MLADYEMFEKFGGGETNKQGHFVDTSPCHLGKQCWSVLLALKVPMKQKFLILSMKEQEKNRKIAVHCFLMSFLVPER